MSAVWVAVAAFLVGLVATVVGDLVSEEVRTRLDRLPFFLIRVAGRRLDEGIRRETTSEWTAELNEILRRHRSSALPLTRLAIGTHYAFGLLRSAGAINHTLTVAAPPRRTRALMIMLLVALSASGVSAWVARQQRDAASRASQAALAATLTGLRAQALTLEQGLSADERTLVQLEDLAVGECSGQAGPGLTGIAGTGYECRMRRVTADSFRRDHPTADRLKQLGRLEQQIAELERQAAAVK
jgi:hypothetical protein